MRIKTVGENRLGGRIGLPPSAQAKTEPQSAVQTPPSGSHQHYCADHRPGLTPAPAPCAAGLEGLPAGEHKAMYTSAQPHARPFEVTLEKLPDGRWLVPIFNGLDGNGGPVDGRNEKFALRRYPRGSRTPQGRRRKHAATQRFLVVGGDGKVDHDWRVRNTYCTTRGDKGMETRYTYRGTLTCDDRGQLFVKVDSQVRGAAIGAHIPG